MDRHDYVMPDALLSDDGDLPAEEAAAILTTLNQTTVSPPTVEPAAQEPAGTESDDGDSPADLAAAILANLNQTTVNPPTVEPAAQEPAGTESDDGDSPADLAAAILATLNQTTINPPTIEPATQEPTGTGSTISIASDAEEGANMPSDAEEEATMPSDAEWGFTMPGSTIIDIAPPPPADNIITQYAYLQENKPLPIITVSPDIREEITLNNFRYLRGNKIKSFINHRVKKLAAQKTAAEAVVLQNRVRDHIEILRNAGLDRVAEANAGVHELHTGLKKMERKFCSDEVITLRNENFELSRDLEKRERDWRKLWAYTFEVREKYQKVTNRALCAEREIFDLQDRLAAKQLEAELELVVSGRYQATALLPLRTAISKPAQKAYLRTILFATASLALFAISTLAYTLFYYNYVPQVGVERTIHLQFGWILYHHRILSYLIFTTAFWVVSMASSGLAWVVLSSYLSAALTDPKSEDRDRDSTAAIKTEQSEYSDEPLDPLSTEDLSDTSRTFPTLGRQMPLRYTGRHDAAKREEEEARVKEEEIERTTGIQPLMAEADDEDDEDFGGTLGRDSGLGTSLDEGDRRGVERRRKALFGGGGRG
ncbi:MAG: tubulin-tyrosine ligase [Lasallia pustulata]|uniref:Tubulin-tyrosine ligase n=1 Tax=Lasallia pustulata TaxID=136370 RepID=A0A5M8PNA8_9LECA|nr:MAG: tubulin-tyrosine ligase [Lasallia pustulata]